MPESPRGWRAGGEVSGWGAGNWTQSWDPSDSSSLGLICLFSGAIALCIHFADKMEGSPRGANPGRGAGRQAAGLWTGSDRGDQAWDLRQPEEGRHLRERGASCPETRTLHSLWRASETTGCLPKGFKERPPQASAGPQPL